MVFVSGPIVINGLIHALNITSYFSAGKLFILLRALAIT
jgi:hypothetical protein